MAGAGYKLFNTGDVLTAAQVNTYLMEQTVMVFADAAARTTALTGVVSEGMISYLKDTNAVEVYDGSNWVSSDDPNAIQNTIVDAKGDLISASAADTPARLAVGNNGETLVADSSTTTGLRWSADWNTGKNKIINGDFGIWQRGTSFSGTNQLVYTADRWQLNDFSGQTSNFARSTFTPGTAPVSGYEGQFFGTWSKGGAGTASSYLTQKIEDVRTFAGQTVTFSFWAKAAATESIDFYIEQNFGSGGSATVGFGVTTFSISTSWTRYSATISVPSISGKTVGTSSFLAVNFEGKTSTGAFTIDLWGMQLEAGSVATPFTTATGTLAGELAACQRYFMVYGGDKIYERFGGGSSSATTDGRCYAHLPVPMRTTPTLTTSTVSDWQLVLPGVAGVAATAITLSSDESSPRIAALTVTIGTNANFGGSKAIVLAANNSTNARINLSAEL
jgi:hypothetical protein